MYLYFPLMRKFTCEQTKINFGFFSIRRTTVTQLLPHLRMVSSYGHSQAADTRANVDLFDQNGTLYRIFYSDHIFQFLMIILKYCEVQRCTVNMKNP